MEEQNESINSFDDKWGIETGLKSKALQVYANRQNIIENALESSTSDRNMGNDFLMFEKTQGAILKNQIRDMLVNLFSYNNVPPTLNTAELETILRSYGGGACVGLDEQGDLVIIGRADGLGYNIYGSIVPSFFDSNKDLFANKKVITDRNLSGDYVVFYNKQSFTDFYGTDIEIVDHYANLLATIKATERMNILQMRTPYIFKGNKGGVNGQVLQKNIMSGDLFIEVDQNSDLTDKLSLLPLNISDRTVSLQNAYRNTMNDLLTLFGVYNNPETKKERLTAGESSANNHVIEGMGDIYLNARKHAVSLLNRAFGLEIEVEWNSSVATAFRNLSRN